MAFHSALPSKILQPFIKQYWAIENCLTTGNEHIQRIVPNGLTDMIFYLGDRPIINDDDRSINENVIINGQLQSFYDILIKGHLKMFAITFQPMGAAMFFKLPMNELYNLGVPVKDLVGTAINEIEEKLYNALGFEERVGIIESYLLSLLSRHYKGYQVARMERTLNLISGANATNVQQLASVACCSKKQYERIFNDLVGASPKHFIKVVRFQRTLYNRQLNTTGNLTELACQSGYFDQSHMIRDFKYFSGLTTGQYFAECEPVSDYFM